MMYLTQLVLNPRCRAVRSDLADPYQLHRTLLRAFPDAENGGPGRVLYRVERPRGEVRFVVLVQSDIAPDWTRLDDLDDYLLMPPATKTFAPAFTAGQRLCFRLRANPTVKRDGKRRPLLGESEQRDWLERKAIEAGFRILRTEISSEGPSCGYKTAGGATITLTHHAVLFDGLLEVTNAQRFQQVQQTGIGSAKAFGFGLLSLARAED